VSVVSGQKPVPSRRSRVDTARAASGPVWRQYLRALGPGLVTGASDDDPSGIATYSQAGAKFGFGLLWVALLTLPLMAAVQEICDRTALATAKSLGELAAERFAKRGRVVIAVLPPSGRACTCCTPARPGCGHSWREPGSRPW